MSLKRRCSQLFEAPLKLPRLDSSLKECRRESPMSLGKSSSSSSACSSQNDSVAGSIEMGEGDEDYYHQLELIMDRFYEEIQRENRLISEDNHLLSTTHRCSTGLSSVRDFIPVVKLDLVNQFVDQYGRTLSFIQCEWETLLLHLSTAVKQYFLLEEGKEEDVPLLIIFGDYRITPDKFLNEKRIKLQWNDKAFLYLTKGEVFKLLDLSDLIGKRLKMLSELAFSDIYYDLLSVVNEIQDPYEKSRVEEVPKNLIMKLASCNVKSVELLFTELLVYCPDRIIKDLNKLRCIY